MLKQNMYYDLIVGKSAPKLVVTKVVKTVSKVEIGHW
jgi:hypothetical protein